MPMTVVAESECTDAIETMSHRVYDPLHPDAAYDFEDVREAFENDAREDLKDDLRRAAEWNVRHENPLTDDHTEGSFLSESATLHGSVIEHVAFGSLSEEARERFVDTQVRTTRRVAGMAAGAMYDAVCSDVWKRIRRNAEDRREEIDAC